MEKNIFDLLIALKELISTILGFVLGWLSFCLQDKYREQKSNRSLLRSLHREIKKNWAYMKILREYPERINQLDDNCLSHIMKVDVSLPRAIHIYDLQIRHANQLIGDYLRTKDLHTSDFSKMTPDNKNILVAKRTQVLNHFDDLDKTIENTIQQLERDFKFLKNDKQK